MPRKQAARGKPAKRKPVVHQAKTLEDDARLREMLQNPDFKAFGKMVGQAVRDPQASSKASKPAAR